MNNKPRIERITEGIMDLPALPTVVAKIVELVDNPRTNAAMLARLISTDPALTIKMLKLANSAFYGFPRRIGTINLAIVLLGFETVKDLGISASLVERFNFNDPGIDFDMTHFWEHSIGTAIAARLIIQEGQYRVVGEAFVAGLLHDIGRLVIIRYLPDEYREIQRLIREENLILWEAEKKVLGMTHADIGGRLTHRWNLPDQLVDAIRYHHQPLEQEKLSTLTAITYFADFLSRKHSPHFAQEGQVYGVAEPVANLLRLRRNAEGEVDLEDYLTKFDQEFQRAQTFRELVRGQHLSDIPDELR